MLAGRAISTPAPASDQRRLPLYAMLAGSAVSLVGNAVTGLAIPWFVLETTGSAGRTGLTAFAGMLPTVVGALLGGALVDHLGRKRTSVLADIASGGSVAAIPLLYHTLGLPLWALIVLVFLGALLDSPGNTARQALVPGLAAHAGMPLERVNATFQTIQSLSMVVGPMLAGLLIAGFGASNVLWLDTASFLVSALLVARFVPAPAVAAAAEAREPFLANVTAGLRFIWNDAFLRGLLLPAMLINFLGSPLFAVVLPVFAKREYGQAVDFGLMLAGFGVGSVTGSLAYGAVGLKLPKRWTLAAAFTLFALPTWGLAVAPPLAGTIALLVLAGLLGAPINVIAVSAIQTRTPEAMLGRVLGAVFAMAAALAPLGMLVAGVAIEGAGVTATLLAIALVTTAAGVRIALNPALAALDAPA